LHRDHASKTDVRIIDFVDAGHPALLRMWEKRQRGYRAMGYRMAIETSSGHRGSAGDLGKPVPATEHSMQKALIE